MKGKFIVFEGLDGSGSSTQAKSLYDFLLQQNMFAAITAEPTESAVGREIRNFLRGNSPKYFTPRHAQQLFVADRVLHISNFILPHLLEGTNIVCVRYYFSTFAYGVSDGIDLESLLEWNKEFPIPDAVIFVDTFPEVCISRIQKAVRTGERKQAEHYEKLEKLKQVRESYLTGFREWGKRVNKRIFRVEGNQSVEVVFNEIKNIITPILTG